jgi:small subunit ribosomal protein S4e
MSHLKRKNAPLKWGIPRKGAPFIPKSDLNGMPVLIALRDILKLVKNRKELKKAIYKKEILICNKEIRDEKRTIKLLDTLTIVPLKKSYRMVLSEKGKFKFEEINEQEKNTKISKIIDKKILRGKKTQINLIDGRNFLSEIKCKVNDSVLINFKTNKIEKCIPLKENARVLIIGGKHAGEEKTIKNINSKMRIIETEDSGKKLKILVNQVMAI